MPQYCCVPGCTNRRATNFHLFKFPLKREPSFLEQWTCIIGKDFHPTEYHVICSAHFTNDDFMIRPNKSGARLKYGAVPSKVETIDSLPSSISNENNSSRSSILSKVDTERLCMDETCTTKSYANEASHDSEQHAMDNADISYPKLVKKRKIMSAMSIHTKMQELTPRERQMQREIKTLRQKLCRKEQKISSLKKLLEGLRCNDRNMQNIDNSPSNFNDTLKAEETDLTTNLEFWMTHLPQPLKDIPIIHLAIPGSHNTMTYTIKRYNDVGPDESMTIRFFGRYFSLISKPIIFNWSVTQYDDIKEQLNGGIRYLDLRLTTKPGSRDIYFLHGLYGSEISKPLCNVADWLSLHPDEVMILDFQHFYSFKNVHHRLLIDKIQNIFKEKLCPALARFNHVSLQQLVLEKYQVFVIYRNSVAKNHINLWCSTFWPTPWPNTVCTNYLIKFLNNELKLRSANTGFVSQCLLTPDIMYVMKHVCGNLERNLVTLCQSAVLSWISEKRSGSTGLNVVIADFVSHDNFIFSKTVIQCNAKLLNGYKTKTSLDN